MSSLAKRRFNRFFDRETGLAIMLPVDHGLTLGPLPGIERVSRVATLLRNPELTAVIAHKGVVSRLDDAGALDHVPAILHVNGMTSLSSGADRKEMLTSLETAAALGVDGVSLQVNFTGDNEAHNLRMLGQVKDEALRFDLPVLTMLYDKVEAPTQALRVKRMRQLLRLTIELGSDAIKVGLPDTAEEAHETYRDLAEDAAILVAGGATATDEEALFARLQAAVAAGARGFCVGRNVFERKSPGGFLRRLRAIGLPRPDAASFARGSRAVTELAY